MPYAALVQATPDCDAISGGPMRVEADHPRKPVYQEPEMVDGTERITARSRYSFRFHHVNSRFAHLTSQTIHKTISVRLMKGQNMNILRIVSCRFVGHKWSTWRKESKTYRQFRRCMKCATTEFRLMTMAEVTKYNAGGAARTRARNRINAGPKQTTTPNLP